MPDNQERYAKIMLAEIIGLAVCFTIVFAGMIVAAPIQANINQHIRQQPDKVRRQNEFWLEVAGRSPLNLQAPYGKLIRDLQPLIENPVISPESATPILPRTLAQLYINSNSDYAGAQSQSSVAIFNNGTSYSCDCGYLTTSFLHKLDLVKSGHVDELIKPIPTHGPLGMTMAPFNWSMQKFFFIVFSFGGVLGLIVGLIGDLMNEPERPDWSLTADNRLLKLGIILLAWPFALALAAVAGLKMVRARTVTLKQRRAYQRSKRVLTPLLKSSRNGQDLLEAWSNLERLQAQRQIAQNDPETAMAYDTEIAECLSLIATLKQELIREANTTNRQIRDHLQAFGAAFDEVSTLK